MNMIHISVATTAVILVGVAIRTIGMNRLPKITFIFIWGTVALRLLTPFSIPVRFSIWDIFDRAKDVHEGSFTENHILIPQWELTSTQLSQGTDNGVAGVITGIWIVGVVISAIYFIVTHYKFRKELGDSLPVENEFVSNWLCEHKIIRSIQIRQSHKISSPLTYGILRPVILIPKTMNWQDETQLKYVFAHEYIHIRRFDYAIKILFAAALCVHWFNPFVWVMYMLANRDIELSCDEAVLKIFGQKAASSYALTLINMAENKNKFIVLFNHFSKNAIEERIEVMINMKKTSIFGAVLAVTLVGGAMTVFASSADSNNTSSPGSIMVESNENGLSQYLIPSREQELEEWISGRDYSAGVIEALRETDHYVLEGNIVTITEDRDGNITTIISPEYEDHGIYGFSWHQWTTLSQ